MRCHQWDVAPPSSSSERATPPSSGGVQLLQHLPGFPWSPPLLGFPAHDPQSPPPPIPSRWTAWGQHCRDPNLPPLFTTVPCSITLPPMQFRKGPFYFFFGFWLCSSSKKNMQLSRMCVVVRRLILHCLWFGNSTRSLSVASIRFACGCLSV